MAQENIKLVPTRKLQVEENVEISFVASSEMYNKTAFVAAAGSEVGRVITTSVRTDSKVSRSFKRSKFQPIVAGAIDLGMRTNAILGIVSALSEIGMEFEGTIAIYANDAVVNDFLDGTAHRIVATGKNGRHEATAEEVTAWALLSATISDVGVLRVRLMPISEASIWFYDKELKKRVRAEIDSDQFSSAPGYKQFNHKMSAKAWDLVESSVRKKEPRAEEVIVEETYEDESAS